ncbi:hypothetical protein J2T56_000197 [Natronobacillus azotifigens]|uniref:Uncharacterized protein n=1 Tax=Natronobacillus azotifigens TaxID=472978 RepID=A0A9J6R7R8_9BACI|nr:hypothetical protein [Natronobacillus azotifigens]MCZ0701599.1 hypothetical protein [Natronobacillus azotifigens]
MIKESRFAYEPMMTYRRLLHEVAWFLALGLDVTQSVQKNIHKSEILFPKQKRE